MVLELSDLPTEVVYQITSRLPSYCFASCALVSERWNAIFTPLLYKNTRLVWQRQRLICHANTGFWKHLTPCPCELEGRCDRDDPDKQCFEAYSSCLSPIPDTTTRLPSLYYLARTVLASSSLAGMVETLSLGGPVPRSIWTDPQHTELTHDDHLNVQKLVLQAGLSQDQSFGLWLQRLDRGLPGAHAALLLLCLSNLRHVEIGSDFHDSLQFVFQDPASLIPRLETACLGINHGQKTVYMGGGRAPFEVGDVSRILSLFRLPAARELTLCLPSPDSAFDWLGEVPLADNLESLELHFTYIGPNDLIRLLMACPTISDLRYDLWTIRPAYFLRYDEQDPFDRTSEALLDISAMRRALLMVKDSLKIFHFHVSPPLLAWTNQCLGHLPFNDFQSLKTLHVPFQMLLGNSRTAKLGESLPSTLVNLWLNDDAAPLWLRHTRYIDAYDYYDDDADVVYDPHFHPVRTDHELVTIMADFLADWRSVTPHLKSIFLLLYDYKECCWSARNSTYIRKSLEPLADKAEPELVVYELPWRSCYPYKASVARGQVAPYFNLAHIESMRLSE